MAFIDKLYGTKKQYREFFEWCQAERPTLLKNFYAPPIYDGGNPLEENEDFWPIANFSCKQDKWLLENCDLEWVVKYIKWQRGIDRSHGWPPFKESN